MLGGVAIHASPQPGHRASAWDGVISRRDEHAIAVLSTRDGSEVFARSGKSYQVCPQERFVAIFSGDLSERTALWNLERKEAVFPFMGTCVALNLYARTVATWGGYEQGAPIGELANGRSLYPLSSGDKDLAFSPNDRRVVASRGRSLEIWDASTGSELFRVLESVGTSIFSPDGLKLACLGGRPMIRSADPPESKPSHSDLPCICIEAERKRKS